MNRRAERFLEACFGREVDCTPVWIMRQAGRYLKEYREMRSKRPFLEMCKTPELAAQVTLLPIDKLGVDAAILFSDILIPVEAMGMPLEFGDRGPVLETPVRNQADIDRLGIPDPHSETPFVMAAIKILRQELEGRVPLIGFSGAPFTLASYMVEGGSSPNFLELKSLMFKEPQAMHSLLDKVASTVAHYLNAQIEAGAQAVQIFDTWAGSLSPRDYEEFALPYTKKAIDSLKRGGIPVIHFVNGGSALLERMKRAGSDVVGLDWRIELGEGRRRLGPEVAVQGNLDPCALFLPVDGIEERVVEILDQTRGMPGHIFNLGHGILPSTLVEHAVALVEAVHKHSRAPGAETEK